MNYVIVAVFDNYITAHVAMGLLENENINCWLKDENTVTIDPILSQAVGGIKLMVAEVQKDRALKILATTQQAYYTQNPCPNCGSTHVEYVSTPRKTRNVLGTLFSALFGGAATPIDKVYHCFDCETEYDIH